MTVGFHTKNYFLFQRKQKKRLSGSLLFFCIKPSFFNKNKCVPK